MPTMVDAAPMPTDDAPFFFLSYAHSVRADRTVQIPDPWIGQLHNDLCEHVSEIVGLPREARAGFMDHDLQPGNEWPDRLANALATCRVFVPLYSRRYFKSEHCGKEWFAFNKRRLNYVARNGHPVETIVPALWVPLAADLLPAAAASLQFSSPDFGELYAEHGFYGLMKVSRWRANYEEATYLLARQIARAAEAAPSAEPVDAMSYETLPSAFGGDGRTGPGEKPLRITIVAPSRDNLPAGRDSSYYGRETRAWNPYRQRSLRPIADHAAELAKSLSYTPEVGDLYRHEAGLVGKEPQPGPEILLVDPWATLQADCREVLQRIDSMDTPWVQVIVVWNQQDPQLEAEADRVRAALQAALPRKLKEGRAISALAVRGVPTLREFGIVLPDVMAEAGRHYLRRASSQLRDPMPQPPESAHG
jgi:FxsC-like protein